MATGDCYDPILNCGSLELLSYLVSNSSGQWAVSPMVTNADHPDFSIYEILSTSADMR